MGAPCFWTELTIMPSRKERREKDEKDKNLYTLCHHAIKQDVLEVKCSIYCSITLLFILVLSVQRDLSVNEDEIQPTLNSIFDSFSEFEF